MKRIVSIMLIVLICLPLCACGKSITKLSTSNYQDYFTLEVSYDDFNEQKGEKYRTCDGQILIGLREKADVDTEVDAISVEVTLEHPWSFYGSPFKTVSLKKEEGKQTVWYASLDCQAESILVNTSISLRRSDISVKVVDISGYVN